MLNFLKMILTASLLRSAKSMVNEILVVWNERNRNLKKGC